MNTSIKTKEGTIFDVITQQYEVGLYIAIYKRGSSEAPAQGSVHTREISYHRKLRQKALKRGDEVLLQDSSFIPETRKKASKI